MEFVHGKPWSKEVVGNNNNKAELFQQLDQILSVLKASNFVHGDIRAPNLLVREKKLWLIDFEFAGKEKERCYPHDLGKAFKGIADGMDKISSMHDTKLVEKLKLLTEGK